jgi:iron(III) transport system ATP-binding protein
MTGFALTGVHKSFGPNAPVLTGVDLSIESGTLTAILGASGSGKTTLLRILAGFERVDAGVVAIGEATVDDGRRFVVPEKRRIGYVPQEGALFPHLPVSRNIGFGLRGRRSSGSDRVAELIELVGLGGLSERYPHELSGGQQQRVALARALAISPSLVLLDEPFSSLDAALRASVRTDVAHVLRSAGATALLVTHDQDEALSMADRVAVLRDGVIAQVGTPQELYERPLDLDLARFLGEANVVRGVASHGTVATPFGQTPMHAGTASDDGEVVVMLRPEQVMITAGQDGPGVRGRVEELHYFGHDTIMAVRPTDGVHTGGLDVIRARIVGTPELSPGDAVTASVRGTVSAWSTGRSAG